MSIFITAFIWGTGISLGLCVGLAAWTWLRPLVGSKDEWMTVKEYNRMSIEALEERNRLTYLQIAATERIANAAEAVR